MEKKALDDALLKIEYEKGWEQGLKDGMKTIKNAVLQKLADIKKVKRIYNVPNADKVIKEKDVIKILNEIK